MSDRTRMTDVSKAARDLAKARERASAAEEALAQIIRAALSDGWSASLIGEATGLSRQRIYQIRDGKR